MSLKDFTCSRWFLTKWHELELINEETDFSSLTLTYLSQYLCNLMVLTFDILILTNCSIRILWIETSKGSTTSECNSYFRNFDSVQDSSGGGLSSFTLLAVLYRFWKGGGVAGSWFPVDLKVWNIKFENQLRFKPQCFHQTTHFSFWILKIL